MKNIQVLDCTLRDGGYYNKWDFSLDLVSRYLRAIHFSGVQIVEVGFRNMEWQGYYGPFAYSSDALLKELDIPKDIQIAVMINAKEFLSDARKGKDTLKKLFAPAANSRVQWVRVAAPVDSVEECRFIFDFLKERGYRTALNLMQCANLNDRKIKSICECLRKWHAVDVLYLADSTGSLHPGQARALVESIKKQAKSLPVGIHAHDNMGKALANSLAAIEGGATWVDGTVLGMGRGAGNVRTESLLLELKNLGQNHFYPDALFPLVLRDFEALKSRYGWGSSLLYYLSGMYGIHPTYVQELLKNPREETEKILSGLEFLKRTGPASFKAENLAKAINHTMPGKSTGSWSPRHWIRNKSLLILGSGPSLQAYKEQIAGFIKARKPTVISLNINKHIPENLINAYAACHHTRLLMDSDRYRRLKKPLLIPESAIPTAIRHKFSSLKILDYGMKTEANRFEVQETACTIPLLLVAAYTLAIGAASGCRRIFLCGFDGYEPMDPRREEMEKVFALYRAMPNAPPVISLTPTTYSVQQASVYSPRLLNGENKYERAI